MTDQPTPSPQGAGVEALREAIDWLRDCSDWLLSNDLDMQMPDGVLDTDPLDIADQLETLASLPSASAPEAGLKKCRCGPGDIFPCYYCSVASSPSEPVAGEVRAALAKVDAVAHQSHRFRNNEVGWIIPDDEWQNLRDAILSSPVTDHLRKVCEGITDDYMTSEAHHPGYVLIPTAKFDAILAALASSQSKPVAGEVNYEELSIDHGQQVSVSFKDPKDAFALFNELKSRSCLASSPVAEPVGEGCEHDWQAMGGIRFRCSRCGSESGTKA